MLTSDQKFFILKRLSYEGLVSLGRLEFVGATFMIEKTESMTVEEKLETLRVSCRGIQGRLQLPRKRLSVALVELLAEILWTTTILSLLGSQFDGKDEEKKLHLASEVHFALEGELVTADRLNRHEIVDWKFRQIRGCHLYIPTHLTLRSDLQSHTMIPASLVRHFVPT